MCRRSGSPSLRATCNEVRHDRAGKLMLGFAAPAFLGFLALVGVIVLLHAQRRQRRQVPSLMFWRELQIQAGARRAQRRWPPASWPLFLQIAAAVLAALALAQPMLGRLRAPDHLIVVLDGSAGMAVTEADGRSRLAHALDWLDDELNALETVGPERISLVLAAPQPQILAAHWTWRRGVLEPVLAELAPIQGPADWPSVARAVGGLQLPDEVTRTIVLSHTGLAAPLAGTGAEDIRIGTARPNLYLTVRAEPAGDAGQYRIVGQGRFADGLDVATVRFGYSDDPGVTPLVWAEQVLEPDEGGLASFSKTLDLPGPGILTLSVDDVPHAHFVLEKPAETVPVLYIGDGDQPLLRAMQAHDGVALFQADSLPSDLAGYALVIVDDVEVARQPEVATLWIGAGRIAGEPLPTLAEAPDPDDWDSNHPLARQIDWASLALTRARVTTIRPAAAVLLSSRGRPLVQAQAAPGRRDVWLAFDPADSNWPDTPNMALFAAMLFDWAGLPSGITRAAACVVGVPCDIDGRFAERGLVRVAGTGPDPVVEKLPTGTFVPRNAGLFAVGAGSGSAESLLAVNAMAGADTAHADGVSERILPRGLASWFLALAALAVAADTAIAARARNRFRAPAPLSVLAVVTMGAAAFDLVAPNLHKRETLILVEGELVEEGQGRMEPGLLGPRLAVVRSGTVPQVARPASGVAAEVDRPGAHIGHGFETVALAAAMVPATGQGRLLLSGDVALGPDTGALERLLSDLAARGGQFVVDRVATSPLSATEVVLRGIDAPPVVIEGEPVPLTLRIEAGAEMETEVTLFSGEERVGTRGITLRQGSNRVETRLPPQQAGALLVAASLPQGNGDLAANNHAGRMVDVQPQRPIAVVSPAPDHGEAFVALLARQGIDADLIDPGDVPYYVRGWLPYAGIVLLNTPALAMSPRQQEVIENAVGNHGIGLLILGGPGSFGPGGYFETPLERLSPLSSRVPRDAPEVAMVFVLDRSGSMQQRVGDGTRLDLAKRATVAATELLHPESQIGVVVFDAEAQQILPLSGLDADRLGKALDGVDPGGGTAIFPGLVEAWAMLRDAQSPARHVIVMTDGLSQPGNWPAILSQMTEAGVSVSAVAIGRGADRVSVEEIAALGGGAAHFSEDFEALPSILSKEAMMLATPVEEGAQQPRWQDTDAPFLAGLPNPMPPLYGFVRTTAKPEARLAMSAPDSEGEDAPILGWWRYGNGQVMAFSSDATGPWTESWHDLPGYAGLWAGALRAFLPGALPPGLHLDAQNDGEVLMVALTAIDRDGAPLRDLASVVEVTPPEGTVTQRELYEEAPGVYRLRQPLGATGRYDVVLVDAGASPVTAAALQAVVDGETPVRAASYHAYPASLGAGPVTGTAAWLSQQTGGVERDFDTVMEAGGGIAWGARPAGRFWTLVALTLFIAELVRRYAEFPRRAPRPSMTGDAG